MRLTMATIAGLISLGCTFPSLDAQSDNVTDEVRRTVTLARDADVEVRGINGAVTIETAAGLRSAEVRVSIRASSREAIERRPIHIESTSNSLTIRTDKEERSRNGRDRVHHDVWVRMPREVNLDISGVNGNVEVGEITGEVGLDSINGRTAVRHAGTVTRISSINGHTSMAVARLGERGLTVNGLNGGIDIELPRDIGAEFDATNVNGGIDVDLPMTVTGGQRHGRLSGRIGGGGPRVVISAVNGGVSLRARQN